MNKKNKKNLIIACVGDNSYHKHWLKGVKRNFDLILIYFGRTQGRYKKDAKYYFHMRGTFKLETIYNIVNKLRDVVEKYDAIGLPDDDCFTNTSSINKAFQLFHKYNLDLAQPSVSGGYISHLITRQNPNCILRFTNFAEAQFPIFKNQIFFRLLNTFILNRSGWGIDYLWAKMLQGKNIAIIDAVGICHGWGKESPFYEKLKTKKVDFKREMEALVSQYDLDCNKIEYKRLRNSIIGKIVLTGKMIIKRALFKAYTHFNK